MSIKLLHNLVAIRKVDGEQTSPGGIQLVKQEEQYKGTVVAVGPGIHTNAGTFVKTTVKVGDEVLYTKGSGEMKKIDGEELLIITEPNVVGILQ